MRSGVLLSIGAMTLWGLLPLYIKLLQSVPAVELLCHRIVWSLPVTALLLLAVGGARRFRAIGQALRDPRAALLFFTTALLIAGNWCTFIWAVNRGHIVEASLGYFISPLFNALLAAVFLKERLTRPQYAAVAIVAAGVAWIVWCVGSMPIETLLLPFTFGVYGVLRRQARLGALEGLTIETAILTPVALAVLVWMDWTGTGVTMQGDATQWLLLLFAGPVTAAPLLLFTEGSRRASYTVVAFTQYLSPTLQFSLGLFVYGEPFDPDRAIGFAVIWTGIAAFTALRLHLWPRRA